MGRVQIDVYRLRTVKYLVEHATFGAILSIELQLPDNVPEKHSRTDGLNLVVEAGGIVNHARQHRCRRLTTSFSLDHNTGRHLVDRLRVAQIDKCATYKNKHGEQEVLPIKHQDREDCSKTETETGHLATLFLFQQFLKIVDGYFTFVCHSVKDKLFYLNYY